MRPYNKLILSNVVMNTTINGPAMELKEIFGFCIQATYTGTPTGTLKLQCAVTPVQEGGTTVPEPATADWNDIADSSFVISSAGTYTWNFHDSMFTWVRLVYTDASGGTSTAVLSARMNAKGI